MERDGSTSRLGKTELRRTLTDARPHVLWTKDAVYEGRVHRSLVEHALTLREGEDSRQSGRCRFDTIWCGATPDDCGSGSLRRELGLQRVSDGPHRPSAVASSV